MQCLVGLQIIHLLLLFGIVGAGQFAALNSFLCTGFRQIGIDPNQRQRAVVFAVFIIKALFLNLAALVHSIHGTQYATALGDFFKFAVDSLLDQICQLINNK